MNKMHKYNNNNNIYQAQTIEVHHTILYRNECLTFLAWALCAQLCCYTLTANCCCYCVLFLFISLTCANFFPTLALWLHAKHKLNANERSENITSTNFPVCKCMCISWNVVKFCCFFFVFHILEIAEQLKFSIHKMSTQNGTVNVLTCSSKGKSPSFFPCDAFFYSLFEFVIWFLWTSMYHNW